MHQNLYMQKYSQRGRLAGRWMYRGGVGIIPSSQKTSCFSEGVLPDDVFTHLKLQVRIFFRRENLIVQAPPPPQS